MVTTTTAVPQCPKRSVPTGISQIQAPGSALSLEAGAAVPDGLLADLAQYLCIARVDQGDSGPLTVHIFANADDFVTAYVAVVPGPADRPRNLISQGVRAETRPGHIWFTPNVLRSGGPTLGETTFHEYFHTVQRYLIGRASYSVPVWLTEGTGLFFGYSRADAFGLDDFNRFRASEVAIAKRSTQSLSEFEQPAGVSIAQAYALGFLATEYLTKTYGMDKVRRDFWVGMASGGDWRAAFEKTFGISVGRFYEDFDTHRKTL